jgi:hypothetical protein
MDTIPEEPGWSRAEMADLVRKTVAHMEKYTANLIAHGADQADVVQDLKGVEDRSRAAEDRVALRALAVWRLRRQLF